MDEDDIDDINELEARLYAQIHHEQADASTANDVTAYEEPAPVRVVTSTSVINNKTVDKTPAGRYWSDRNPLQQQSPKPNFYSKTNHPQAGNNSPRSQSPKVSMPPVATPAVTPEGQVTPNNSGKNAIPVETVEEPLQPMDHIPIETTRVVPNASGSDPKFIGSKSPKENPSSKKETNKPAPTKKKGKNILEHPKAGPFVKNFIKMAKAQKYEKKKQKAKDVRGKKSAKIETIVLESTDEDDDDIIEIPVPPPPLLVIEDSSDEVEDTRKEDDSNEFAKPKKLKETADKKQENNSSRCTSPCSVISDDFIGQNDRSRLLNETNIPDDEDLLCLQESVDGFLRAQKEIENAPKSTPEAVKPQRKTSSDYRVTQTNFRAIDVYESESDIQESVYAKGTKPVRTVEPCYVQSDSSDVEVEEVDAIQKTKRLRKRRASSSNKESEANNESTDSEEEEAESAVNSTGLPFISRGEAVENCKEPKRRKVSQSSSRVSRDVNSSDNEFINMLTTMAKGQVQEESEPETDNDDITARTIAEDVINKSQSKQVAHRNNESALPDDEAMKEMEHAFDMIDNMDKQKSSGNSSDVQEVLPTPQPLGTSIQTLEQTRSHDAVDDLPDTRDKLFNVVYSEKRTTSCGIGWNEETCRFYRDSWGGESFNVRRIRQNMNPADCWKIYTDDRFPKTRKFSHLKCMNCCEMGHSRARCTRPRKPQICYMCGETGHMEPRCPNTLCLKCGNKTRVFTKSCNACSFQNRVVCPICKLRGHSVDLCPDKWRRYHSTRLPNTYPNNKVQYSDYIWCCICSQRGHLPENCRSAVRFMEYPAIGSRVKSHLKAYDDQPMKVNYVGVPFHLHYKPEEHTSYQLAENASPKSFYTRFLRAVGLQHLLERKRRKSTTEVELVEPPPPKMGRVDLTNETETFDVLDSDSENAQDGETPVTPVAEESQFKIPESVSEIDKSLKTPEEGKEPLNLDSDSNYSFSDHFGASSNAVIASTTAGPLTATESREMEPLPDFIPLTDNNDDEMPSDTETGGISSKFIEASSDDEDDESNGNKLPEIPCEAKIYLTNFHSKYLLSPDGNKFLVENSNKCDVKVRLDWTSVGHILIIFGLRADQDRFHTELLLMFRTLSDKINRKTLENSQKVPRKREVLIRFIRESIGQLQNNLGNVNDLHKRLLVLENQHTKSSWKSAERIRRLLNMIFLGQAALREGKKHLDDLLANLDTLLSNCTDELVSNELRDQIDSNWRYIFSSYRHENYSDMVEMYNELKKNNEIPVLNIDARLLGNGVLDVSLTKEQKEKMEKDPKTPKIKTIKHHQQNVNTKGTDKLPSPWQPPTPQKSERKGCLVLNPVSVKRNKASPREGQNRHSAKGKETPPPPPSMTIPKAASRNSTPKNTPPLPPPPSMTMPKAASRNSTPKNTPPPPPPPSMTMPKAASRNSTPKKTPPPPPPFTTPKSWTRGSAPKSTPNSLLPQESIPSAEIGQANFKEQFEKHCNNLLNRIHSQTAEKHPRECKNPSAFWSRECMRFIDECMRIAQGNPGLLEKLSRVKTKAKNGLLSYNDYRAVIQIQNAIKGKHG